MGTQAHLTSSIGAADGRFAWPKLPGAKGPLPSHSEATVGYHSER